MLKKAISMLILALACCFAHASVSFHAGDESFEVGSGTFLHCFFSTISANLEPKGWGSRFPILMNKLYQGKVNVKELGELKKEVQKVREELRPLPPSKVVWDIEDRGKQPPWGNDIAPTITNLSNYFVTSDGKDMFEVFFKAISKAKKKKTPLVIE